MSEGLAITGLPENGVYPQAQVDADRAAITGLERQFKQPPVVPEAQELLVDVLGSPVTYADLLASDPEKKRPTTVTQVLSVDTD